MFNVNGYDITLSKGDTGVIRITTTTTYTFAAEDRAVFTLKDGTGAIVKEVVAELTEENGVFTVEFFNGDTDQLAAGSYNWDVRYVIHPYYDESGKIINGDQVITPRQPMGLTLLNVVGEV